MRRTNAVRTDGGAVEHADTAAGDRAHGVFLMAGQAELAHEQDVERKAERPGDGEADRNAAARQSQHQRVGASGVAGQRQRQEFAGLRAVFEVSEGFHTSSTGERHFGCTNVEK
ncbi:hypothetical protein [Massilia rubra]|uniref:hypothetical protein n=1 Tax=Massilia rubra TaxID=2607910 RepID=UPI00141E7669|nr:hypothetical protein [Massilia rubra]